MIRHGHSTQFGISKGRFEIWRRRDSRSLFSVRLERRTEVGSPELFAIGWLVALLAITAIYHFYQYWTGTYSAWECILLVPVYFMVRWQWRASIVGTFPLGLHDGAVLVANHRSSIDPFFLQLAPGRRIHWMVAKEYCQHAILGVPLRWFQVIPTNRGGIDTGSTKLAIRYAQAGDLVGMFPEGKLNHSTEPLLPVRPGAALVAIRAGVPLLPCYIEGSPYRRTVLSPFFMPANVRIHFGRPIFPEPTSGTETDSNQVAAKLMLSAMKEVLRLSGFPNHQPQLAGKKWLDEESPTA